MKFHKIRISFFLPFIVAFTFSCGNEDTTEENTHADTTATTSDTENDDIKQEQSVICMWDAVSLRETPTSKGKYITTIYLGEAASTFGESVRDSSTSRVRDYIKIKLGDGTEGWVQENLVAIDATPYVVANKTKLYKRPDILTAGNKEFDRMQFVVVTEVNENWMKVKGKRQDAEWFSEGWVKPSSLIGSKTDIAVAILVGRALKKESRTEKIKALNEIMSDFSDTQFMTDIMEFSDDLSMENLDPDTGFNEDEGVY